MLVKWCLSTIWKSSHTLKFAVCYGILMAPGGGGGTGDGGGGGVVTVVVIPLREIRGKTCHVFINAAVSPVHHLIYSSC